MPTPVINRRTAEHVRCCLAEGICPAEGHPLGEGKAGRYGACHTCRKTWTLGQYLPQGGYFVSRVEGRLDKADYYNADGSLRFKSCSPIPEPERMPPPWHFPVPAA